MLIGDVKNFLDGNGAAGIQAEGVSLLDDLGRGKFALALVHIEITTPKNLLSEVASGSVKVSQNVVMPFPYSPGTRRAGGLSKKEGTRATGTLVC